jgi:NADH-quinone oxidoreductase subunit E
MLSDRERERIEEEARHHEQRRAAVSEALLIVQESRGWVSDEGIADVAEALGMSVEEVDGIATFYELIYRHPVGRHVIMVCDSVSCWITGEERILGHLRRRLGIEPGGTTKDGSFTLLPVGCLGACDAGPAMMIDGELFDNLTTERTDEILARYGMPQGAADGMGADAQTAHR